MNSPWEIRRSFETNLCSSRVQSAFKVSLTVKNIFYPIQTYFIYYGPLTSGVSSQPVGHTVARHFSVGSLQQDIVYVFEVSVGLTGKHSDPVNSKTKFGL